MTMESTSFTNSQVNQSGESSSLVSKVAAQVFGLGSKAIVYLKTRHRQRIDRQAFSNMLSLDTAILQDIGVTREDVIWASKLPLSQNAALELDKVARANRIMRF